MKKITIKELAANIAGIQNSNEIIRFMTSSTGSFVFWGTMVVLNNNKMFTLIAPSLTCEVEMSCEPLEELVIHHFLLDNSDDTGFDGKHVYTIDELSVDYNRIKATVILGESAVQEYEDNNTIPSEEWLYEHGGIVDEKEFKTKAEYDAYALGLKDADGWGKTMLL